MCVHTGGEIVGKLHAQIVQRNPVVFFVKCRLKQRMGLSAKQLPKFYCLECAKSLSTLMSSNFTHFSVHYVLFVANPRVDKMQGQVKAV